ncbi:MAG TPA: hypothetical protein VJ824_02725 [Bacillota bacterium]|nr:hypothetical protein [Bacillota bacterium]
MHTLLSFLSNFWLPILIFLFARIYVRLKSKQGTQPQTRVPVPQGSHLNKKENQRSVSTHEQRGKQRQQIEGGRDKQKASSKLDAPQSDKQPSTSWPSAVQGMMWSEVLGPPRSKQPFRRK